MGRPKKSEKSAKKRKSENEEEFALNYPLNYGNECKQTDGKSRPEFCSE